MIDQGYLANLTFRLLMRIGPRSAYWGMIVFGCQYNRNDLRKLFKRGDAHVMLVLLYSNPGCWRKMDFVGSQEVGDTATQSFKEEWTGIENLGLPGQLCWPDDGIYSEISLAEWAIFQIVKPSESKQEEIHRSMTTGGLESALRCCGRFRFDHSSASVAPEP